ncbi:MAG TPA: histidine kinase, partial [Longimicrobium sp.]|nr:histidine kinase [Longimicrobium sp.]
MPDTDAPRRNSRLRALLWIFGAWTAVGVFNQSRPFVLAATGLGASPDLGELAGGFFDIYLWALLTPPMLWVSARFPFSRATWRRSLPVHVAAGLAVALLGAIANYPIQRALGEVSPAVKLPEFAVRSLFFNLQWYAIMVVIGHVVTFQREARDRAVRASRLEAQLARAQLQALRMQIQPHFLFNTINAISELVYEDARLADRTLMRLADLLRLLVDQGGTQEVSLRQELAFLSAYLEIQK